MKILIGGGTGFVGRYLVYQLRQEGYNVINISRSSGQNRMTWDDLYNNGLPEDTYAVVNLAGQLLMDPSKRWNESFKSTIRSSRIETTRHLAEAVAVAKNPPKVWVSSSAIGYYPPSEHKEYDEYSKEGKGDFMAELCSEWEKVAKLQPGSHTREVIIRTGIVLGRDGGVIKNMYLPFFMGVGGRMGSGQQWFPWIHARDCAGIIKHAIENDGVTGVLNAVAPQLATNAEFTSAFASAMWRPAFFPVPEFALNFVFGTERARVVLTGQKVQPKRTIESGYQYQYPDLASACQQCAKMSVISPENEFMP